jgi:hypothetical protein
MIQTFEYRIERPLDVREIHQPARVLVNLALTDHFDPETMPVQPGTLVPFRGILKPMSRLERKRPNQPHMAASLNPRRTLRF